MMPFKAELSLDDLLRDALVQRLMLSDGVEEAALRGLLAGVKRARRQSGDIADDAYLPVAPAIFGSCSCL
jgi:hypothetical protein